MHEKFQYRIEKTAKMLRFERPDRFLQFHDKAFSILDLYYNNKLDL